MVKKIKATSTSKMRPSRRSKKASFWKRLIACVIDSIAISMVMLLITDVLRMTRTGETVFGFVMFYGYFVILEYYLRSTIGKAIMNLRVIRVDGRKPKFSDSFCRNIGKMVSMLPLYQGFARILAPHQRQTIHDELGRCLVIDIS